MFTPSHLAQLRNLQEAHLTETVRVERVGDGTFDPATGLNTPVRVKVWEGRGQVVSSDTVETEAGGRLIATTQVVVKVPVKGTEAIRRGHEVTVTDSIIPGLPGLVVRLTGEPLGGWLTLRRFPAEVITGED